MFTKVKHNFENFLATYVVNFLLKKSEKQFKNSLKKIIGLEHRLELVGNFKIFFFIMIVKQLILNHQEML